MRARGKVGLYFITGIKETQNGTRAARTRARITSTLTQQIKDAGSGSGERVSSIKKGTWRGTPTPLGVFVWPSQPERREAPRQV